MSLQIINIMSRNEELDRSFRLLSDSAVTASAAASFPPQEVANFLIRIFLQYAQTNYFIPTNNACVTSLTAFSHKLGISSLVILHGYVLY